MIAGIGMDSLDLIAIVVALTFLMSLIVWRLTQKS